MCSVRLCLRACVCGVYAAAEDVRYEAEAKHIQTNTQLELNPLTKSLTPRDLNLGFCIQLLISLQRVQHWNIQYITVNSTAQ